MSSMENTENTVENQRPDHLWKPGQSGNPKGKPKGAKHMSTLLLEAIKAVAEDGGTTEDKEIVKALIKRAKTGDPKAIDMIFDRTEGKVDQGLNVGGELKIVFDTTFEENATS